MHMFQSGLVQAVIDTVVGGGDAGDLSSVPHPIVVMPILLYIFIRRVVCN